MATTATTTAAITTITASGSVRSIDAADAQDGGFLTPSGLRFGQGTSWSATVITLQADQIARCAAFRDFSGRTDLQFLQQPLPLLANLVVWSTDLVGNGMGGIIQQCG
jgi:hypothetical protein